MNIHSYKKTPPNTLLCFDIVSYLRKDGQEFAKDYTSWIQRVNQTEVK